MKGTGKRILALLVACLLMIPVSIANAASGRDSSLDCTLTVNTKEDCAEAAQEWVFDLYLVAYMQENETLEAAPGFEALSDDLSSAGEEADWSALAQKALQLAKDGVASAAYTECALNNETMVGNEHGVYMVVVHRAGETMYDCIEERCDEETGGTYLVTVANSADKEYTFSPVLVTLPGYEEGGENTAGGSGSWIYDVSVNLKMEENDRTQKKLILHKVNESGERLPDAEFKLYATRAADDSVLSDDDTITVYVEGQGYVTLYCVGTYTTDQNGNVVIDDPLMDDSILYAWVETKAPDGYELDPEPHFFFSHGIVWVGNYLGTRLIYDDENPNATGSVTFERYAQENKNNVTLRNTSNIGLPVYVRVRVYGSEEGYLDGKSLGSFGTEVAGDGWRYNEDGYWYYGEVLDPGDVTETLMIDVSCIDDPTLSGIAGRAVIVYDFAEVLYDENGRPYADWGYGGAEASLPSDEAPVMPIARVIESDADLRATGRWYFPEECSYDWDYKDGDSVNGVTVVNKREETTPPGGSELPETGGIGTVWFTVTGTAMIVIASILLVRKKRRSV